MATVFNNRQDLVFAFSGGNLIVQDMLEEYDDIDLSEYICLEYLVYDGELRNITIRESIEDTSDIEYSSFTLQSDGKHTYYRILVPRARKYVELGVFQKNDLFYYKKNFYYATEDTLFDKHLNLNEEPFVRVNIENLSSVIEELDYDSHHDVIYTNYTIFSYELLKKAFVEAQNSYTSGTGNIKTRNLLLTGLLTIREYIRMGNFDKAQSLITTIEEGSCFDFSSLIKKKEVTVCGCGPHNIIDTITYISILEDDDFDYTSTGWLFGDTFPIKFL